MSPQSPAGSSQPGPEPGKLPPGDPGARRTAPIADDEDTMLGVDSSIAGKETRAAGGDRTIGDQPPADHADTVIKPASPPPGKPAPGPHPLSGTSYSVEATLIEPPPEFDPSTPGADLEDTVIKPTPPPPSSPRAVPSRPKLQDERPSSALESARISTSLPDAGAAHGRPTPARDTGDPSVQQTILSQAGSEDSATQGTFISARGAGGDPATIDDEDLLAAPSRQQTMLTDSAGDSGPGRQQLSATAALSQFAPTRGPRGRAAAGGFLIGRFEVQKILGQGAFGTVYLAHDPHLDRPVAVKVAKAGVFSGKQEIDRFLREARAAAQLRHPHIIPVYEVGEADESNFIAYEFIKGRTLKGYLEEQKRLSPQEASKFTRKLAGALHYAHVQGIIHRDMKPENVLLDERLEPHVADFGLARRDEGDVTRTREGMYMGTPAYMSPEQAMGKAHQADARADIWSLGVMLREMLTGRRPFEGKLTEVLRAVVEVEPPPIRQLDASLPIDLETICQKCMAKAPAARYQTAQELADELERWERGEPILARPIGLLGRTLLWMRRNPQVAGLIGAVFATLLIGAATSTYFAIDARRKSNLAEQEQARRAVAQLNALMTSSPAALPVQVANLRPNREDLRERLDELLAGRPPSLAANGQTPAPGGPAEATKPPAEVPVRARVAFAALFPEDPRVPELLNTLPEELIEAPPEELLPVVELLEPHAAQLKDQFWGVARATNRPPEDRVRAAAALARLDRDGASWPAIASDTVDALAIADAWELPLWLEAFHPVRDQLRPELERRFARGESTAQRQAASVMLSRLFEEQLDLLAPLVSQAIPEQLPALIAALETDGDAVSAELEAGLRAEYDLARKDVAAGGPAPAEDDDHDRAAVNGACALAALGKGDAVWPLLGPTPDRRFRTVLIETAPRAGVPWRVLADALDDDQPPEALAALVLALGDYGLSELPPSARRELRTKLMAMITAHPHPGVHSACQWTLERFGFGDEVRTVQTELRSPDRLAGRGWQITPPGVSLAVFDGPIEFAMGCRSDASPEFQSVERPHVRRIPRTFGVALREVTVDEFLKFRSDFDRHLENGADPNCPISSVTWLDAARFCRWLSEQEGIPESEMCFPPMEEIDAVEQTGQPLALPADVLQRTGYRLPTAAEWEYACRAGAGTDRPWSHWDDRLDRYAWYERNAANRTHPVGLLRPNDAGLFDVLGNVMEWCIDEYFEEYPAESAEGVVVDGDDSREGDLRELRGGHFAAGPEFLRAPDRDSDQVFIEGRFFGFRLARTYRSSGKPDAATGE